MTSARICVLSAILASPAIMPSLLAAQTTPAPPGAIATNRGRDFVDLAIVSPGPYALALGGGLIDEMSSFPEEWTGGKGFGQRVLARVGSGLASDSIGHAAAAILHHRVRYEACGCAGPVRRTAHAFSRGFVTRHDSGAIVVHSSVFIAKFGAAGLQNGWYPASYTGGDVLREGLVGIGVNAALNIAREFSPELLRLIGIRRSPASVNRSGT
jgi:hypothetical protein